MPLSNTPLITEWQAAMGIVVASFLSVFARFLKNEQMSLSEYFGRVILTVMFAEMAFIVYLWFPNAPAVVIAAIGGGIAALGTPKLIEIAERVIKK